MRAVKQGLFLRFLIITWHRLLKTERQNQRLKTGNIEELVILSQTDYAK